jgi:hypothetical protein
LVSFAPLDVDAVVFLTEETGIDFRSIDFDRPDWFCVTCRNGHDAVVGVLACEFKTPFDVHWSIALADPACLSWRLIHAVFTALFTRAARITALIDPNNKRALIQARKFGFIVEGYLRFGLDGRHDAVLLGMTPESCRWLKPRQRRSQGRPVATREARSW